MTATITNQKRLAPEQAQLEELRTIEQIEAISGEWQELWRRSGESPFQSPAWLVPWATHFTGENLLVLTIRIQSRLAAVAPFYTWRAGSETRLLLLGNGISDYLNICAEPLFAQEVAALIGEWLAESKDWDRVEFNQLPGTSVLLRLYPGIAAREAGEACPVLDLRGKSLTDFAPPRQLENLRYYRRRAEKLGTLKAEMADAETCEEIMSELFRLHALRWSSRGEHGVLRDAKVQAFYCDAAQRLASCGLLRLHALRLNRRIVGVLYAFANRRSTYYYISGFDPEFEKLSPGTLLIGQAIEQALREGHASFNFLRGSERYKFAWGAVEEQLARFILSSEW
jgi:CelD/BcsL family acetyltransferase involved in cellulose biosynthesis